MKKLLVICSHFPPSYNVGANRPRWFARHLPPLGWKPFFITSPPRALDGPTPREASDIPDTPVIRITSQFFWKPLAIFHAVRWVRREKIDLIYSTSPNTTVHFIGWMTRLFTGVPWICEFRDPWTLQWVFRNPLRKIWYEFLERQCVRRADHVVTVGHVLKAQFAQRGGISDRKVSVVFNGYEHLLETPQGAPEETASSEGLLRIGYFGTVNLFSSPLPFLCALGQLLARRPDLRPRLRFDFYGYFKSCVGLEEEWRETIQKYALDGVVYSHGAVSRSEAMTQLRSANWLLLVVGGPAGTAELYRSRVPAKIFDCLALQKPVFTIAPLHGEAADIIRATECGRVLPFTHVDAISDALEEIADRPLKKCHRSPKAQQAVDRLAIQWQLKQLSIVLNSVLRTTHTATPRIARLKKAVLRTGFGIAGLLYAPWKVWRRFDWIHSPPKKVLVLASHSGVGNTILLLPMLSALRARWPALRLSVLVRSAASADLLRSQPCVNEVLHLPLGKDISFREEMRLLRKQWADKSFDCAISTFLEPHEENAVRALLSGAKYRISFNRDIFRALDTLSLKEIPGGHEIDNHLLIARQLSAGERSAPELVVPQASQLTAERILREQGWEDRPRVGVHPGSDATTAAKRWDLNHFIEVAQAVRRTQPEIQFLFFFGPHEKDLREKFRQKETPGLQAVGELPLMDTAALIKSCHAFLANDSGLMHMAAAVGVPTVAIFGPTIASKNAPVGDRHSVIREALPCSPCYDGRWVRDNGQGTSFEPPCDGAIDCLKNLPLDHVVAEIQMRLPKPTPAKGATHARV